MPFRAGCPRSRGAVPAVLPPILPPPQYHQAQPPRPAAASHSPRPQATFQNATTCMYIYRTKPQNTRYIKIQRGDAPIRTVQGTHYRGGGEEARPPHLLPTTHRPLPATGWRGSPGKGTLQGTAQTQPRGEGGTGLGGRQRQTGPPPTSVDTGDQWGGTGQDKQTHG